MSRIHFRPWSPSPEEWSRLDAAPDRTLFQTSAWLNFVARTQKAKPVFLDVWREADRVGWFAGFIVPKGPFRILASPFRGWTTPYMGFNLTADLDLGKATRALSDYAFRFLRCVHVELADPSLDRAAAERADLGFNAAHTYEVDLRKSEAELLAGMHHSPRRYIRKAMRERHVTVEEASPEGFADEYFSQLQEVYARSSLVPTYNVQRVKALIECVFPTGALLLLRARDRVGRSIATGIFPAFNRLMYFWGGADRRVYQTLHPNEPLQWHAMLYWKRRGMTRYDMGGGENYKEKYGALPREMPWIAQSRSGFFRLLRDYAQRVHALGVQIRGLKARANLS